MELENILVAPPFRSNQRKCSLVLREFSIFGDKRAKERLTFSSILLPSDIPNNIFHALGDGFQLNLTTLVSVPRDHQPRLPLWSRDYTRTNSSFYPYVLRMYHSESHVHDHSTRGTCESIRHDECFSTRFCPVLCYPYGIRIFWERRAKKRSHAARCDAIGIHESLEVSFGDACLL